MISGRLAQVLHFSRKKVLVTLYYVWMWRASSDKLGSSFKILVLPGQKSHAVTWKLADIEYGIVLVKKFHWPVLKVFLSHCSSALQSKVQSIISRKPLSSYCAFTVFMPNCCSFTVFIPINLQFLYQFLYQVFAWSVDWFNGFSTFFWLARWLL